ncbi:MAG: divalent-cation tolerance protein CutA [Vulcanococcus sp.]
MPAPVILALTTEADPERAEALARTLLERRLAACVALSPQTSLYHWQGQLECSREVRLLIKTDATRLEELEQLVHTLHSYDTPMWLHWPASAGEPYGLWLAEACGG